MSRKDESLKHIEQMEEAWRQLPNETGDAYALFLEFLNSDTRIIKDFLEKREFDPSYLYPKDFCWTIRAQAYDCALNEQTANTLFIQEIRQRIADYKKYTDLENRTVEVINDLLDSVDIIDSKQSYSLNQTTGSLKVFNEIRRLLAQLPTEITQNDTNINGTVNKSIAISDSQLFDGIAKIENELNGKQE